MSFNKKFWISGEGLYLRQLVGNFNKIPVNRLKDGVTATLVEELPLDEYNKLDRVIHRLLVSGSIIIVDEQILPGEVLFVSEQYDTIIAYHAFTNAKGQRFIKKWERGEVDTTVSTYNASSITSQDISRIDILEDKLAKMEPLEEVTIASEGIIIVDNGILIPAVDTIDRIAELMDILEETSGDEALTWFISNWVGDINKLMSKTKKGGRFAALPDGAVLQNAFDDGFSNRIFKELDMLRPLYLEVTSSFVIVPGESGIARYLGMLGYINKIKQTQMLSTFIFDKYGISISYDNTMWQQSVVDSIE